MDPTLLRIVNLTVSIPISIILDSIILENRLVAYLLFLFLDKSSRIIVKEECVTGMDKNFGFFGRYFIEISFFGEPRKEKCTEILFVRFFSDFFTVFSFKNLKKLFLVGFEPTPKCLDVAHSNHQAIDCTYYIWCKLFLYYLIIYFFIIPTTI